VARLNVAIATHEDRYLLQLQGELDISTSDLLAAKVASVHGSVLIDCEQLTFVDSNGFAALIALRKQADSVVLFRATSELREMLHIMNLSGAVSIVDDWS
jgi:anti-anti-sigma factor